MPVSGNVNGFAIMQTARLVDVDMLESQLLKAHYALSVLLNKNPAMSEMVCGSDTLGNTLISLAETINGNLRGPHVQVAPIGERS